MLETPTAKFYGFMLCYNSLYPNCREDLYLLDSREYLLFNLYCPNPDRDCGDVILAFSDAHEVVPGRNVGEVGLPFPRRQRL